MNRCTLNKHGSGTWRFPIYVAAFVVTLAALFCILNTESDTSTADVSNGTCGTDLDWTYDSDTNTLTITGTGTTMDDYDHDMNKHEWETSPSVIIDMSGATNMTNIGAYAFYNMTISEIRFSPSLTTIGNAAFMYDGNNDLSYVFKDVGGNNDCAAADLAGRISKYVSEHPGQFWIVDLRVGDVITSTDFIYRITELLSETKCALTIEGLSPGATLPSGGILNIPRSMSIWIAHGTLVAGSITSVGENAFSGNTDLETLYLWEYVSSVGAGAFKNCTNLKEMKVNVNIDLATGKPFEGCNNIEKITFYQGNETDGKGFSYSDSNAVKTTPMYYSRNTLTSVEFYDGVTEIGNYTLKGCSALGTVKLPSSGLSVIGDYAFSGSGIQTIKTPASLKTIGENAFYNCKSLTTADIRGSSLEIKPYAFYGCSNLTNLTLNEGVGNISTLAFAYIGVTNVTLPNSAILNSGDVFLNSNLESYAVNSTNTRYNVDDKGVLYSEDGKTLVAAPKKLSGTYTVSNGTTTLGVASFRGVDISELNLPLGIKIYGKYVFQSCSNLEKIVLTVDANGSTVTFDNKAAESLQGVNASGGFEYVGFGFGVADTSGYSEEMKNKIGDRPVYSATFGTITDFGEGKLTLSIAYTLREGEIADRIYVAYVNGDDLEKMEGSYSDGKVTFSTNHLSDFAVMCSAYAGDCGTGVTWSFDADSGTITISGNGAMADYADVSEVPWNALMNEYMTKLVVKDGVTRIGNYAFYDSYLESVDFGNKVESIGVDAFYNTLVENISLPDSLTDIESCAFYLCESLKSVTFGKNVETIGDAAFACCGELRSVTIPGKVSVIGEETFRACVSMETLVIPDSVTVIRSSAFEECTGLESVKFGNSIEEIESGAFMNCTALKSVVLPATVNTMENDAFLGCYGITEFVLKSADLGGSSLCVEFGTTEHHANVTVYTDMPEDKIVYNSDTTTVTHKSLADYNPDDGKNDNTLIYVVVIGVAAVVVLFLVMFFLHLGPFARKD